MRSEPEGRRRTVQVAQLGVLWCELGRVDLRVVRKDVRPPSLRVRLSEFNCEDVVRLNGRGKEDGQPKGQERRGGREER